MTTPTPATTRDEPGSLETREMMLNIGPAHPAMHGIVRIVAILEGEKIKDAEVEIGYLHRGFEKMAEVVDYNGVNLPIGREKGSLPDSNGDSFAGVGFFFPRVEPNSTIRPVIPPASTKHTAIPMYSFIARCCADNIH